MAQWITTTEAARLSGYTLDHIRDLIKNKRVKGQLWGRQWQVDRRSLLAYLEGKREARCKARKETKARSLTAMI